MRLIVRQLVVPMLERGAVLRRSLRDQSVESENERGGVEIVRRCCHRLFGYGDRLRDDDGHFEVRL